MGVVVDVYTLTKDLITEAKKQKNMDLVEKLLYIQELIFELREENASLKKKVESLEESEDVKNDLEQLDNGLLFRISEKENGKQILYCPACYVDSKKLYPIVRTIGNARQCSKCHGVYR